jgi:putative redox protein
LEIIANASGSIGVRGYQVLIEIGPHQLLADEPVIMGGDDAGPDPYSLVLSGLISCTAITLKMYAARKNWPLENAVVSCRLFRPQPGAPPEIERVILLTGNLSEDQQQRLLQIANACPIHKLLSAGGLVHSRLRDSE